MSVKVNYLPSRRGCAGRVAHPDGDVVLKDNLMHGYAVLLLSMCKGVWGGWHTWTGMRFSGRPRAAVRKMEATSPMLEEIM